MPSHAAPPSWIAPLRGLLRERLGHALPEERIRGEIAAFATQRARALGVPGPDAWVALLQEPQGAEEWRRLVRAATVGETYFCRHPEQLAALTAFARGLHLTLARPLEVWSAGCATGEEAWSLAILLAEAGVPSRVLATDVNDVSLARARSARGYSERSVRHMPATLRGRWLEEGPGGAGVRASPALEVRFQVHNLALEAPPRSGAHDGRFDVIVCRNVLLYFPADLAGQVVRRLLLALAPDGALWLGPADGVPPDLLRAHRDLQDGERFLRPYEVQREPGPAPPRPLTSPASVPAQAPAPGASAAPTAPDVAGLLARGLVASAEEALERRVAADRDDGEALLALGAIALSRHDFEAAHAYMERAGAAFPRPAGHDYLRGLLLLRQGRTPEAMDAFVDALEADPDDWAASIQLALRYRALDRPLQEEVMLEHALLRLGEEPVHAPDHGPAASVVESVHLDPAAALRLVRERLRPSTAPTTSRPA